MLAGFDRSMLVHWVAVYAVRGKRPKGTSWLRHLAVPSLAQEAALNASLSHQFSIIAWGRFRGKASHGHFKAGDSEIGWQFADLF